MTAIHTIGVTVSDQTPRAAGPGPANPPPRRVVELDPIEALHLLGSVRLGRIVFTHDALPAVSPATHVLDEHGELVFRTDTASTLAAVLGTEFGGAVVAYQADRIDDETLLGWSVSVVGLASPVTDPDLVKRYNERCAPWTESRTANLVALRPQLVSGQRIG
jgi:hypothetical protein